MTDIRDHLVTYYAAFPFVASDEGIAVDEAAGPSIGVQPHNTTLQAFVRARRLRLLGLFAPGWHMCNFTQFQYL